MPIYEAIYRINDIEEPVTINSIEQYHNFSEVRNNIFCTYENCEAKLEYVPKGKNKAHFKTWPKQNHTIDCIDYFEREKKGRATKNSATATMALSDQHIKNILNEIKRRRKNEKLNISGTPKPKKPRKRPKTDPSLPASTGINVNPTTSQDANMKEGEEKVKAPSVRRRNLVLLNDDDVGFTRSLSDVTIENVEISEERVILTVMQDAKTCNIYFEQFFFSSAPVSFIDRFEGLKVIVSKNKGLFFSCVGEVVRRNGNIHMLVNKHSDFRVEDLYLTLYIHSYREE